MTSRKFRALLIGNWNYSDPDGILRQLKGPRNDIARWSDALTHSEFGLFDEVIPKKNLTGKQLGEELLQFVNDASPEDALLIYFSGHGERRASQQLGFCDVDLQHSTREAGCFRSGVLSEWLTKRNRAKSTIVVLDFCYSGDFKGTPQDAELESFGTGTAVLSSGGNELTKDTSLVGEASGLVSTSTIYEALPRYRPRLNP